MEFWIENDYFHIEIIMSATEMRGGSGGVRGHDPREKLEMIDAIWCVLMYYFHQIKSKKVPLFIIKTIDYTHLATLLLLVILLPE